MLATSLGIGYIKGGGTIAAVFCCALWYWAWHDTLPPILLTSAVALIVTLVGVWVSTEMVPLWGKDPSKVVIDEVAGMAISLLFVPIKWQYVLVALVFFRFFDMLKPIGIRRMEKFPLGWGIMLDDVLSGVYSCVLMQVVMAFWKV